MRGLWRCLTSLLLTSCASTAHERFGDVAHYSPSYASYVIGDREHPEILRDPLTKEKLRCREDLGRVEPIVAGKLDDDAHDRSRANTSNAVFGPFYVVGHTLMGMGEVMLVPALKIHEIFASDQPRTIYKKGREAFLAGRFDQAREHFLVITIDRGWGDAAVDNLPRDWIDRSLYYLALSDEALHRDDEARAAFRQFLVTSSTEDAERYRDAELRLARLGDTSFPACASREDLTFAWRGAR